MSTAELSIRDELAAALKASTEPPAEVEETAEPEVEVLETKETTAQERARDEKGRFAAKDGERSDSAAEVRGVDPKAGVRREDSGVRAGEGQKPAATGDDKDKTGAGEGNSAPALAPPNGWPAEAKAKWHELPAEIMAAVQQREKDIAKFTSTRDEHASFGKEIYQTVQPYLATIKAEGGTPTTAIQSLLNTAYVLRTGTPEQKRQVLLGAAKQYGVDLGTPSAGQQATPDTGFAALQQEIATLKNELSQFKTAGVEQLQSEVQAEIAAFAADPKHPHYEAVKGHMSALIAGGAAKDLQDAYDQAVWARPDTRATLEAQRRAEEEQKRRADAKRKADEAKRKNVSLTGGPGNTAAASAPEGRSIRDELLAAQSASSGAV